MKMMALVHSKTQKTLQRNLSDEKEKIRENFDRECILTNIIFILHFELLPLQYLKFYYYMTVDDKNGVTYIFFKKLAASKTNKYKKNYKYNIRDGKI